MALSLSSQNWLLRPSGKFNLLQTPKAAIYSALSLWNFQNKFPQSKAIPKDISVPEALDYITHSLSYGTEGTEKKYCLPTSRRSRSKGP